MVMRKEKNGKAKRVNEEEGEERGGNKGGGGYGYIRPTPTRAPERVYISPAGKFRRVSNRAAREIWQL